MLSFIFDCEYERVSAQTMRLQDWMQSVRETGVTHEQCQQQEKWLEEAKREAQIQAAHLPRGAV